MEIVELSWEKVKEDTLKLFEKVKTEFTPDIVVFIAKGGYEIGRIMAEAFNCPLLEIKAARKKSFLKRVSEPFLPYLPKTLCKILRNKEVGSGYHNRNQEREVTFDDLQLNDGNHVEKILLVDDSVDTGHSVKQCVDVLHEKFNGVSIKVAALNIFSDSENIVKTDYFLYKNTCMAGPWSADSKELKEFNNKYNDWKKMSKSSR